MAASNTQVASARKDIMGITTTFAIVSMGGALAVAAAGWAGTASADPAEFGNGFGNAQATIDALKMQGYIVMLNGAAVYPLSGCKVTGVEGLRSDNSNPAGNRIDPTRFDTVYVDIACKGG